MKYNLLALTGLALIGCATSSTTLNRVSVGMTKAQVMGIMGEPQSTRANAGVEYLTYTLREGISRPGTTPVPIVYEGQYFVRITGGFVDSYGKMGDFDSTHPPEAKIDVDWNTRSNGQPVPSFTEFDRAMQRGMDAFRRQDFKTAESELKQATVLNPVSARAWACLGGAYGSLAKYSEMLYTYKRATELDPTLPEAWAGLAAAYYKLDQHDKYDEALAKLRQMNPTLADTVETALKQVTPKP